MARLVTYIEEATDELMNKVTWPTWKELQSSAIVVMIASFIISLIIYVMDMASSNALVWIYKTIAQ